MACSMVVDMAMEVKGEDVQSLEWTRLNTQYNVLLALYKDTKTQRG